MDVSLNKRLKDDYRECGRTFVDMIKEHHLYGVWIDAVTEYKVKLVSDKSTRKSVHWYLVVKKKEYSKSLPYITFEIITTETTDLMQATRDIVDCSFDASDLMCCKESLLKVCQLADEVVSELKVGECNSRDFCDELSKKLKINASEPPATFDLPPKIGCKRKCTTSTQSASPAKVPKVIESSDVATPQKLRSYSGDCEVDGSQVHPKLPVSKSFSTRKLFMDDHQALVKILAPIKTKWRDIGLKLLPLNILNQIKHCRHNDAKNCLDKMLKSYIIQKSKRVPTHKKLAKAAEKFSKKAAREIIKLSKSKKTK